MPRFLPLLMAAALTASCGPSQPTETVDFLVAHPERLKEVQRLCKDCLLYTSPSPRDS